MTQVTVTLDEEEEKVVGVVKSIYGFSSKDKAIQFIIKEKGEEILEKELRPEFIQKMLQLEKKGKFEKPASLKKLREGIENA